MKSRFVLFISIAILAQLVLPVSSQNQIGITPEITHNSPPYYEIQANTTDGGKVVVNFRWQKTVEWWGHTSTFSTLPILCMSKINEDNSLNYSITYMPFYILQYNDTNENGLFDLGLSTHTKWGADYDSLNHHESIYAMYPLTPILPWSFGKDSWNWTVTDLVDQQITVNDVETHEYSWNISATLLSFPWTWKWGWKNGIESTIEVQFRYNIIFYPTGPEVKYDFNFSGVSWVKPEAKLAMKSIVLYIGEKSPIVKADGWSGEEFKDTKQITGSKFTISEEIEEKILAWTITYENATVDLQDNVQPISWAIHPIFLFPIGLHPYGTYFEGVSPTGTYKIGFAHQLGLPHFEEHISQDPVVGLAATLSTVILPFLPRDILPLEVVITAVIIVTVAFTIYTKFGTPSRLGRVI